MWNELVTLFTEMGSLPAMFLAIGMVLGIIEIIVPGFGIFGIMGIVMTALGIVFRIMIGASLTQVFIMIFIIVSAIFLLLTMFTYSARFGFLSRTGFIQSGTSVPINYASDESNYAFLLGKEGLTVTICKPVGKIVINNLQYQVLSNGEYLPKGIRIKIIEVDGADIVVKKI